MKRILTRKQTMVFELIMKGRCNGEIARALSVTVGCVKFHKTNLFKLYNVSDTPGLIKKRMDEVSRI